MPKEYPPPHHMMRDLRLAIARDEGGATATLPIVPEILNDRGEVRAGALATLVDVFGGSLAVEAATPNWLATLDLSLHLSAPLLAGSVHARGSVLRAGRHTVVLEVALASDAGADAGLATMTFAILPRRPETPVYDRAFAQSRTDFALPGSGLTAPFAERLGIRVVDARAGTAELELSDYVTNSLDALQGGAAAALCDVASEAFGRAVFGAPVVTRHLEVRYLALGKASPIRAQARLVRRDAASATLRVEVREAGAEARLCYVAAATVG